MSHVHTSPSGWVKQNNVHQRTAWSHQACHIGATNGHLESWSWCEHACVVGSRELIAHTEHMQRPMSSAMQGHMLSSGGFLSLVPMRGNLGRRSRLELYRFVTNRLIIIPTVDCDTRVLLLYA